MRAGKRRRLHTTSARTERLNGNDADFPVRHSAVLLSAPPPEQVARVRQDPPAPDDHPDLGLAPTYDGPPLPDMPTLAERTMPLPLRISRPGRALLAALSGDDDKPPRPHARALEGQVVGHRPGADVDLEVP